MPAEQSTLASCLAVVLVLLAGLTLAVVLLILGLHLFAVVLLCGSGVFALIGLHYLVWGKWVTRLLRNSEQEEEQAEE